MHPSSDSSSRLDDEPIDITELSNDTVYYVEKILNYRYNPDDNSFEYYVQWLDCPLGFCSWECEGSIYDKELISDFWKEEQSKTKRLMDCESQLSQLRDGLIRIHDALTDENLMERIENIFHEMPIPPRATKPAIETIR